MSQKASLRKQAFTTCTLKDLCPEDKHKVAQLVRQVVELGKENQQLKATAATATTAEEKLRQIQDCNKQAVKENCNLKNKLGQAVTVLRMYHHKVQGLDAALRALQHEAPAAEAAGTQQQQQGGHVEQQVCETPALPLPAPPAAPALRQTAAEQQQLEQADSKAGTTAGQQQATCLQQQEGSPAGQCQQQQQQGLLQQTPGAASSTAGQTPANSPSYHGCCMHANGAVQQQMLQQQQLLLNSQLCSALQGSHILPGSSLALGLPLQQMQAWQLQDRHVLAEQQPRTMLQFDPSIGSCGAYVVQQLPEQPLHLMHSSTPPSAAHSSVATPPAAAVDAAAGPNTLGYQQDSPYQACAGALGAGQQQQQQQQQRRRDGHVVSAGGAATAAAAAAASSALAAVKAAAAMCAAPTWQPGLSSCSISSSPRQGHSQYLAAAAMNGCMVDSRGVDGQGPGAFEAGSWSVAAGPAESHQDPEAGTAVDEVPVLDVPPGTVHVLVQNEKSASSLHQVHARVTPAGGMGGGAASPAASSVLAPAAHPKANPLPSAAAEATAGGAAAGARFGDGQVLWQPQDSQDAWHSDSSRRAQQQQQVADLQRCWIGTDGRVQEGQVQQWVRQQQQQQEAEAPAAQHSFLGSRVSPAGASQLGVQQQQQQHQPGLTQQPMPAGVGPSSYPMQAAAAGTMFRPAPIQQHQVQGHAMGNWQQQPQRQRRTQPHAPQEQRQQQLQGYVLDGAPAADRVSGTRELLLKFDESLLDILAEVERLEQQQQRARQQLQDQQQDQHTHQPYPQLPPQQQQQQQRLPKLPLQPHQQQSYERQPAGATADGAWPARQVTPAAGGLSVSAAGRSQQTYLSHKQAQLQQRIQQLQQEGPLLRSGLSAAAGVGRQHQGWQQEQLPATAAAAAWGYQGASADYEADDVSDILNHLD